MTVKYNVVERSNPSDPEAPRKFYPSIQSTGRVTPRELAELAAEISSLSTVDMVAAIESLMVIIPRELAKGNIVELGEFGSFWLKVNAEAAETPAAVNGSRITNVTPSFRPGKELKRMVADIVFRRN